MNRFLPRLGGILLALIVLLLIALAVARSMFNRYLHGEAFRRTLGNGAAAALHASHADFAPLDFDGALAYSDNFRAERGDGAGFSTIDASQLRASFDWHGLLHHTVQIDELSIQRLTVAPPVAGVSGPAEPAASEEASEPRSRSGSDWKVDLHKAVVNDADFSWAAEAAAGSISGAGLVLTPEGSDAWRIEATGGRVRQAGWPALDLETAQLRWQKPTLYINSSSLRSGASHLTVTGSVEAHRALDLQVKLEGVDVQPLVSADWKKRIDGRLSGDATVQAPLGGEAGAPAATVSGKISLNDGHLTALPILDEIGIFTRTQRFRQLDLTRASADFTREPGRTVVRNMIMEAEGLIRVEGSFTIEHGDIDGTFQVGLTPATLQWIPGSQGQIFVTSHDGYLWSPMKLSGPADHPVDDLTPRLVAAAANGVIDQVQGTVNKASQGVQKATQGVLDLLLH